MLAGLARVLVDGHWVNSRRGFGEGSGAARQQPERAQSGSSGRIIIAWWRIRPIRHDRAVTNGASAKTLRVYGVFVLAPAVSGGERHGRRPCVRLEESVVAAVQPPAAQRRDRVRAALDAPAHSAALESSGHGVAVAPGVEAHDRLAALLGIAAALAVAAARRRPQVFRRVAVVDDLLLRLGTRRRTPAGSTPRHRPAGVRQIFGDGRWERGLADGTPAFPAWRRNRLPKICRTPSPCRFSSRCAFWCYTRPNLTWARCAAILHAL